MEFTVFTIAGGFREFPGDSSYTIGEHNGVLHVWDGATSQVITYGASAWASVQERDRDEKPGAGKRRLVSEESPAETAG